jgi:hypothetical protein
MSFRFFAMCLGPLLAFHARAAKIQQFARKGKASIAVVDKL